MNNRNKALIITGVLVGICALIALLVGGWLAGWDFAAYFTSNAFVWLCALVGVYVIVVVVILIKDWVNKI